MVTSAGLSNHTKCLQADLVAEVALADVLEGVVLLLVSSKVYKPINIKSLIFLRRYRFGPRIESSKLFHLTPNVRISNNKIKLMDIRCVGLLQL